MSKDYYNILGVEKGATDEEIKKAYRKLAHKHHPDKAGGDEARFKEVNEAYQVLSDKEKRSQYDQYGQTFEQAQSQGGFGGFEGFRDFSSFADGFEFNFGGGQRRQAGFSGFEDIFGDIFEQAGFGGPRSRRSRTARGEDIQVDMEITFSEMAEGMEKDLEIYKYVKCSSCDGDGVEPGSKKVRCSTCKGEGQVQTQRRTILGTFSQVTVCPECHGEGKVPEKKCKKCSGSGRIQEYEKIKVKIPAGIKDGQSIRLENLGEAGEHGGQAGDLYVAIHVLPDKRFERKDDDIHSEAKISFSQAALGDKIEVETIGGEVRLKIPAGTQSGEVFRLKGHGVKHLSHFGHGDQYVKIQVVTPRDLTREEKEIFEKLKK
ncbi:MAG: molecular chaperone DnaJ [Candidatus Moranbacteria bacterium]|nr:molecular chaperone DnaJ [Candidatus Moranbacteria bacterium]